MAQKLRGADDCCGSRGPDQQGTCECHRFIGVSPHQATGCSWYTATLRSENDLHSCGFPEESYVPHGKVGAASLVGLGRAHCRGLFSGAKEEDENATSRSAARTRAPGKQMSKRRALAALGGPSLGAALLTMAWICPMTSQTWQVNQREQRPDWV
jgi:hypothetical protein